MLKDIPFQYSHLSLGKQAGKNAYTSIKKATKSVRVMSPYLSEDLLDLLSEKQQAGVKVELLTTTDVVSGSNPLRKKLIVQHKEEIPEAITDNYRIEAEERQSQKKYSHTMKGITWGTFGGAIIMIYFGLSGWYWLIAIGLTLRYVASFKFSRRKRCNKTIAYKYFYTTPLPVKITISPQDSKQFEADTFLHSKVIIVDKEKAFFGSMNLTHHGFFNNYETVINTTDYALIAQLNKEFEEIWRGEGGFRLLDIHQWGRKNYQEPLY